MYNARLAPKADTKTFIPMDIKPKCSPEWLEKAKLSQQRLNKRAMPALNKEHRK